MREKTIAIQLYDVTFESLGVIFMTLSLFYFYKKLKESSIVEYA